AYSKRLAYELDRFAEGSELHHKISIIYSKDLVICTVELVFCDTSLDVTVQPVNSDSQSFFKEIQQKLREKFSQWVYIQRGFRIIENSKIHICKTARLIDWTETQALLDSDDIIAEILSMNL
ncbi:hypothetical protein, partial [Spirulina sp. 06S082]|uniref:hypothetical protein n=1 Tax=Spirulina sp. 06S082 TaxID=3110248 RepID=UPI002B1FF238